MRYAQVETISDKKIFTTDTKFIKDFQNYNQVTKNKVYHVLKSGKSVKCIILKTGNSIEDINNPNIRIRRPKVNPSSLEEMSPNSEGSIDLLRAKRKRQIRGQNQRQIEKRMSDEILKSYKNLRDKKAHQSNVDKENDPSQVVIPDSEDESSRDGDDGTYGGDGSGDNGSESNDTEDAASDDEIFDEENSGNGDAEDIVNHDDDDRFQQYENSNLETLDNNAELFNPQDREHQNNLINQTNNTADQVQQSTTNTHGRHINVTHGSNEEVQNNNNNETIEQLMEESRQINDEMQPIPRQRHSDDNNEDLQRLQRQQEQQLKEPQLKQRLEEVLRQRQNRRQQQQLADQRRQQRLKELQRQQKLRQDQELEERRRRQRLVEQRRQQLQHAEDEEDQRIIDPVHVGGQIYVSSLSHTEAFRQYKPSKFITVMSHAIWGYRNLALRAVKITKRNQDKLSLTPEKRVVLEHQYHKFLKKRNLSNEMVIMERNNINTYLGRSITSAEKKAMGSG